MHCRMPRKRIAIWKRGKPPAPQFCFLENTAMPKLDTDNNPMSDPEEQPSGSDGTPKFGRLLILLGFGVLMVVALTFGSLAYYTP